MILNLTGASALSLLESSADGVAVADAKGFLSYANKSALRFLGLEQFHSVDLLALIRFEDRHALLGALDASASAGEDFSDRVRFRVAASDSRDRYLEAALRKLPESSKISGGGTIINIREISRDDFGRGREEQELRVKDQLLDLILTNLPVMACRIDKHGIIRESFGAGLRRVGMQDNEAAGKSAFKGWPKASRHLERALRGENVHFEFSSGSGLFSRITEIWFTPNVAHDGSIIGVGLDVTESKRTRTELGNSEAFGRRVIESSRDCIVVLDMAANILSISDNGVRLMEMERAEQCLNHSWFEFWRGGDRAVAEGAFRAAVRVGVGKFQGYCPTVGGTPKWWDVVISPILNPECAPEKLLVVARDITEQKRFEEYLRRSKGQLEVILKAISDAVVVTDDMGRVVYANDAAARLLGLSSSQEMLGEQLAEILAGFEALDEKGKPLSLLPEALPQARTMRFRSLKGGGEKWIVVTCAEIRDGEGLVNLRITSAHDITERKHTEDALRSSEEHLRQSQKMEAMGRLAGGVAHDFNNLLTAINGYSELLSLSLPEEDPLQSTASEIKRAGERAATLTRQLLTFSRKQVLINCVIDLNQIVIEIRAMLGRLIGEDIQLVTSAESSLGKIYADPGQIEQVILNLALNARDAMPTGGSISIETANVKLEPGDSAAFFPVEPGNYARLTITDTGIGMDEEVKAHLFEPFFTTKPPGKGTGLGLSTVYGIVKQARGNLSVTSEPGRGTSISVYFPIVEIGPMEEKAIPKEKIIQTPTARETILLVEDEDMVRKLIGQVLSSQGYYVLQAGSGPQALEMAARHPGVIDLLLTDVVMTGMSGRELSEKLSALRPRMKVLYMSGYTDDAILRHGVLQHTVAFLCKPFSPGTLVRKLREVLEGKEMTVFPPRGDGNHNPESASSDANSLLKP